MLRALDALYGARPAFAHDHGLQFFEFDEIVCLPAQLVRDHWWLRADGGDDADSPAFLLRRFNETAEVAISGENDDVIDHLRHFHDVDGKFDVHVALDAPPSLAVGELLERLCHYRKAVVVQPVDERP